MALASGADLAGCGLAAHLGVLRAAFEADPCVASGAIERHTLAEPGGVHKRGFIFLHAALSHPGFVHIKYLRTYGELTPPSMVT